MYLRKGILIPMLKAVKISAGIEDGTARKRLLEGYNVEIAGGLGRSRASLMDSGTNRRNVALVLSALREIRKR